MTELEIFRLWLYRSGHQIASWWLLVTLVGLAAWPLLFRLLRRLPDRGVTLARPAGIFLSAFALWFLGSLGLLRNDASGAAFAWALVLIVSIIAYFGMRSRDDPDASIGAWLRANWRVVLAGELVFAVMFFVWAVVRAYDPNIAGTEKPMEMAFINAIRRSATFPPNDPWMSGYAISYYYFGYVMIAALAGLSGVVSGVAFNLSSALFFGLTGVVSYGLVFNLVHGRRSAEAERGRPAALQTAALLLALLGPLFVLVVGNLGGLTHLVWTQRIPPDDFFTWLDVRRYNTGLPAQVVPHVQWNAQAGWVWWWQSSRVVHDVDFLGVTANEVIDEYPLFSFLLSDLHPHVLSLPFSLMAIGLALNLVRSRAGLDRYQIIFYALFLGGLIFLNLLDGPLYMVFMVGAEVLRRLIMYQGRLKWFDWVYAALFGAVTGGLALLFYLPFLVGFRSQASGLLPNPMFPTRFQQFFVMFGPFLLIIVFFLIVERRRGYGHLNWRLAVTLTAAVLAGLVVAMVMLGLVALVDPEVQRFAGGMAAQVGDAGSALLAVLGRRLDPMYALTSIVLGAFIVVVIARLFGRRTPIDSAEASDDAQMAKPPAAPGWAGVLLALGLAGSLTLTLLFGAAQAGMPALATGLLSGLCAGALVYVLVQGIWQASTAPGRALPSATFSAESGFALLLIGAGAALTLLPDYIYVTDNFGTRMNTIFKFYYQAWAMWAIAGAYAAYSILGEWVAETGTTLPRWLTVGRWALRLAMACLGLAILASGELARALLAALGVVIFYAAVEAAMAAALAYTERRGRVAWGPVVIQNVFSLYLMIGLAAGLIAPIAGVLADTDYFRSIYHEELDPTTGEIVLHIDRPRLDGTETMFRLPDDEAAIACLSAYEKGDDAVVAEAVSYKAYSQYTRVATLSGIPTVMGWRNHEGQWRGATFGEVAGSRESDMDRFYKAPRLEDIQDIIDRYEIDYIFVGTLERQDFGDSGGLAKFETLDAICRHGDSVVYLTHREK
ncbi:MAG: hypothetical protein JXB47_12205 [Anaerolineae bacterium]|nr:hypothetical protein [Anaerolineae bacterium]